MGEDGDGERGSRARPPGQVRRLLAKALRWVQREDLERRDAELAALRGELIGHAEAAEAALRQHSDTRTDQVVAEVADLRSAYLTTRGEVEADRQRSAGELAGLQRELEQVRDDRVPALERRLDALEASLAAEIGRLGAAVGGVQSELEALRDRALPKLGAALEAVQSTAAELRDARLPALAARFDAIAERLHEEITVTAGLLDRAVLGEPLAAPRSTEVEERLPDAIRHAWAAFADCHRGSREEIGDRAAEYLPLLRDCEPVLDLGCGRGELLETLCRAGVAARGVDNDPAMVETCRRRGLAADVVDARAALASAEPGSLGAVTALHLVEHLTPAAWMELVTLAAHALRSGGRLLLETPNPESIRVASSLFWIDPTHRAPLHPDAVTFVVRAAGLEVEQVKRLHPFPPEQLLADEGQPEPVRRIAERLDAWLSAPRDFLLVARKR